MTDEVTLGVTRRQLARRTLALGGALAVAPFPAGPAQAAAPARRPTLRHGSPERAGLLPAHLRRLVTDAETFLGPSPEHPWYAGAVLLAGRGGTVALHRPIGMAVRYRSYDEKTDTGVEFPAEQRIPMAEDTVFDLASVSKLFTSLLAVQQIERGTLELEGKVAAYLPEFGAAGKQDITVRQLLTHTSGFRSWIPLYNAPTYEEKLQLVWNQAPLNPPGTTYLYSDLNLISLQLVLERITGRTLDVLLREEITGPLGLRSTRYNPPASWKPRIAATEDARKPWSGLERGLVWGEVHDENAFALGGAAGHAGVFSNAWDLAVLGRALLNGGTYGRARILRPESVELMFTDFNTAFPGDEHGLGFELYQHWYMGAMATPRTAGHTGFTGTSLVLDPTTDSFLVVLGNSVHPVRTWRSGSAPRVAAGNNMARAVAVRPARGRTAWFSGMASATNATLTLPALDTSSGDARLRCALWWDVEPADALALEATTDGGATWQPVPFTTEHDGGQDHATGTVTGWSGRVWHRLTADLPTDRRLALRWRYSTDRLYVGRGAYVDALCVKTRDRVLFDASRPADAARIEAVGWTASAD
ncbi:MULTISPECIES: serine hydrolase domain-containing protein [Streptomyces]|uniref:Beta-lactamase n=1 Tax=Streptomyces sviceus (strain ATCC 29083 / DSM 924 / JCM 4929 / NBRC 13980 / NCIMB 11184 / NRRL 5439 / UC 5370) TaxID=463191 RepID=B5I3G5_STRX2|nr:MULTISPECIES: serine hydrolase domain-containing protein [Streptomyces]EDY59652.1 beta-lactamase [Streptomyces sviceus ATCC 29083]MYT03765.1 serine hydrolase [Streptomyces sp. SID5470]